MDDWRNWLEFAEKNIAIAKGRTTVDKADILQWLDAAYDCLRWARQDLEKEIKLKEIRK